MQKLDITLKRSRMFFGLNLFLLMGSVAITAFLDIPVIGKLCLLVIILLYTAWSYSYHSQWKGLSHQDGYWKIWNIKGEWEITPCGSSTVNTIFTVLRFRMPGNRFTSSCVIFKDTMPADTYRRFLVALRYKIR